MIYLDHNATTPIDPRVARAMYDAHLAGHANPASQHQPGRSARRVLEDAREAMIAALGGNTVGMRHDQLILTSGGTEANNLALAGLTHDPSGESTQRIVISAIEHPSVTAAAEVLEQRGTQVEKIRVGRDGVVDLNHLATLLEQNVRLVSVMLGNNETGVIQPINEIVQMCHARDTLVHCDAVQAVGKIDVNFGDLGVDALSFTAHKLHGPCGIGGLLIRHGCTLTPQLFGGFQQAGLRPGTESVALAVGMHTALVCYGEEAAQRTARMEQLRDQLEEGICGQLADVGVHGKAASRLPHTLNLGFEGVDRQALIMALDMAGVACSTGSACASGSSEPSPTLLAMGVSKEQIEGSIRLSLGAFTTESEIESAIDRIVLCVNNLRK